VPGTNWFAGDEDGEQPAPAAPRQRADAQRNERDDRQRSDPDSGRTERPAPEFGPAPPASPSRASFGVTASPISPNHAAPDPITPVEAARPAREPRTSQPRNAATMPPPVRVDRPEKVDKRAEKRAAKAARKAEEAREPELEPGIGQLTGPGREIRPHRATRSGAHGNTPPGGVPRAGVHGNTPPGGVPRPGARGNTPPGGTPVVAAEPPRRSRTAMVASLALTAVVLVIAGVAGVAYFSGSDKSLTSVLKLGAAETTGKTATAPLDGRDTASFDLAAATSKVTVKTQDLGGDLFKVTAAGNSGVRPSPIVKDDDVQLRLTADGNDDGGGLEVLLSSKVRWALRFTAGGDEQIVDLSGGQLARIDVLGASRRFELALPKPSGTVPVRVTGAIEDFSVTSPTGNPVRIQLGSGAKTVAAGDRTLRDVKPGSTLTPKNWNVKDRYDVDAAARLTLLTVAAGQN
jgi:hypothetical protein